MWNKFVNKNCIKFVFLIDANANVKISIKDGKNQKT